MRRGFSFIAVSALALPGCSLLHSNIRSGFACAAPSGTCAPSMTIDDAALRTIGGHDASESDLGQTRLGANKEGGTSGEAGELKLGSGKAVVFIRDAPPALKVVFPAWRDRSGQVHPRTAAYAPVDLPPAPAANASPLDAAQMGVNENASLLAIAEMAPDIRLLGSSPSPVAPPPARTSAQAALASVPASGKSPLGISASPDPLGAIKDQVRQILSTPKKTDAGPAAMQLVPAPARPGLNFPPQGN